MMVSPAPSVLKGSKWKPLISELALLCGGGQVRMQIVGVERIEQARIRRIQGEARASILGTS